MVSSGSGDQSVQLWEVNSGKLMKKLLEHQGSVWLVRYSQDGKKLASGSHDQHSAFMGSRNRQMPASAGRPFGPVCTVRFAPNGKYLVAVPLAKRDRLQFWNVEKGETQRAQPSAIATPLAPSRTAGSTSSQMFPMTGSIYRGFSEGRPLRRQPRRSRSGINLLYFY